MTAVIFKSITITYKVLRFLVDIVHLINEIFVDKKKLLSSKTNRLIEDIVPFNLMCRISDI